LNTLQYAYFLFLNRLLTLEVRSIASCESLLKLQCYIVSFEDKIIVLIKNSKINYNVKDFLPED